MKIRDLITESFQHYTVKHKPSGKTYKVTAMSQASAKTRAAVEHGGRSASKYSGTSDDQFEIVEAVNEIASKTPDNSGAVYSIEVNGALVHRSPSFADIDKRIWKLINGIEIGPKGRLSKIRGNKINAKQVVLKRNGVAVPHKYKGGENRPITGLVSVTEADKKNPYNSFGLKAYKTTEEGKDVYTSVMKGKITGRFRTLEELKQHQQDIIRGFMKPFTKDDDWDNMAPDMDPRAYIDNRNMGHPDGVTSDEEDKLHGRIHKVREDSVGQPITEAEFDRLAEKKDACYHKVKSRYKVWPSAYASGALVQCRKKGAANWGNKSKK